MLAPTLLLLLSSFLATLTAAGPHSGNGLISLDRRKVRIVHRRHHARLGERSCDGGPVTNNNLAGPSALGPANLGNVVGSGNNTAGTTHGDTHNLGQGAGAGGASSAAPAAASASASATTSPYTNLTISAPCSPDGSWQCAGMVLQVCDHAAWVTLATCSGPGIVCSASGAVGCVWADSNGSASNNGAAPAGVGNSTSTDDDGDDEECDDGEDTQVVYASGSQVVTTTILGQGLLANQTATLTSNSNFPAITTAAVAVTTQLANGTYVTVSSNVTVLSVTTSLQTPTSVANLSSILSKTTTASVASVTSAGAVVPAFTAPHWVVYADNWLSKMPTVSALSSYNRFILAFWMSNNGPVDNAQSWTWMDPTYRAQVLQEYHAAGIALMVSAFGSTDAPTSWGYDPVQTAQNLAAFVIQYGFDGVDIDYEDMNAMNNNQAEAWLIPFQQELRNLLPSPYLITHAPVAPWFTSANDYASGAYVNIHQTVGWSIDWYNVQYYNQGNGIYTTCQTMLFKSNSMWPSTSVFELNSYAQVPLNKIVLGKPMDPQAADNGYVTPSLMAQCLQQGNAQGWNGGVMYWEWESIAPSVMATVRGL